MTTTIDMLCAHCQNEFKYLKKEHNRRVKAGKMKFYCSRSCSVKEANRNMTIERRARLADNFGINEGNQFAKKGEFTWYLRKSKGRLLEFDLTEEYLRSIWNGKCALSGIDIELKTGVKRGNKNTMTSASLDRKDSSRGYVKGNVQFVAYGVNLAKNAFPDEEVVRFLNEIRSARD